MIHDSCMYTHESESVHPLSNSLTNDKVYGSDLIYDFHFGHVLSQSAHETSGQSVEPHRLRISCTMPPRVRAAWCSNVLQPRKLLHVTRNLCMARGIVPMTIHIFAIITYSDPNKHGDFFRKHQPSSTLPKRKKAGHLSLAKGF